MFGSRSEGGKVWVKDSSFLLGTSPEYELAVYTLCHLYRAEDGNLPCVITDGTSSINIKTFVKNVPNNIKAVATAFPEI